MSKQKQKNKRKNKKNEKNQNRRKKSKKNKKQEEQEQEEEEEEDNDDGEDQEEAANINQRSAVDSQIFMVESKKLRQSRTLVEIRINSFRDAFETIAHLNSFHG